MGHGPTTRQAIKVSAFTNQILFGKPAIVFKLTRLVVALRILCIANKKARGEPAGFIAASLNQCARIASNNNATMLVILIIGFTAGPAVSL